MRKFVTNHEENQNPSGKEGESFVTQSPETQLLVIGAGPGGYAAAFYAADHGLEVTLVDKEPTPGGVCLFKGCIPSKALLHAAKALSDARAAKNFGIEFGQPKIDLEKMRQWKEGIITKLTGGLGALCKQRKIKYLQGQASFLDAQRVRVHRQDTTEQTLSFQHAVLATGSTPIRLPHLPDSCRVLDSTSALKMDDIPESLLVIGGGYIGLELGSVYAALGSQVTVVEMTDRLLTGIDPDLTALLTKRLNVVFHKILLNTKVARAQELSDGIKVSLQPNAGQMTEQSYTKILVCVGRRPETTGLGIEKTRIELTQRGFIKVDGQRRTAEPAIFAIGDITGEPMLAHKASHEGHVAVEAILGKKSIFEPKAIPAIVFTDPEIACCGLTETQAAKDNRPVEVVKFPWAASGRALTLDRIDGMTKLLVDPQTKRVLGAGLVGAGAGELISEAVLAVEMSAMAEDIQWSIHPHPTLSETIMEAAQAIGGQSTHLYKPKRN